MIKDSPIVEDIRRVRRALSEQFDHDADKYIDYLQRKSESSGQADVVEPSPRSAQNTKTGNRQEN